MIQNQPHIKAPTEDSVFWLPYSYHAFYIGLTDFSCFMWLPMIYDKLLQAVEKPLQTQMIQNLCDTLPEQDEQFDQWSTELKRWLSRAA